MRVVFLLLALMAFRATPQVLMYTGSSGVPTGGCTGTTQQIAACQTATQNAYCLPSVLGDYYAEIDNASGPVWSIQVGSSMTPTTLVQYDSASKLYFATWFLQKIGGYANLIANYPQAVAELHQLDGSTNMPSQCPLSASILTCLAQSPGNSSITSTGSLNPGSSYTPGTYAGTALTGGTGTGATARIVVNGNGNVSSVIIANNGSGYVVNDVLSASLPAGSGFSITVTNTDCNPSTGQTLDGVVISSIAYGANCTPRVGVFSYNGAHFEFVVPVNLSSTYYNMKAAAFTTEYNNTLGSTGCPLTYFEVLMAGGIKGTPQCGLAILRAIINPTTPLLINGALGQQTVCTLPSTSYIGQTLWNPEANGGAGAFVTVTSSTTIPSTGTHWITNGICNAAYAPLPEAYDYSIGHWVESTYDGAFSSAGSKGVYPWVSADKTLVGGIWRLGAGGSGGASLLCGQRIRQAYIQGVAQL